MYRLPAAEMLIRWSSCSALLSFVHVKVGLGWLSTSGYAKTSPPPSTALVVEAPIFEGGLRSVVDRETINKGPGCFFMLCIRYNTRSTAQIQNPHSLSFHIKI